MNSCVSIISFCCLMNYNFDHLSAPAHRRPRRGRHVQLDPRYEPSKLPKSFLVSSLHDKRLTCGPDHDGLPLQGLQRPGDRWLVKRGKTSRGEVCVYLMRKEQAQISCSNGPLFRRHSSISETVLLPPHELFHS